MSQGFLTFSLVFWNFKLFIELKKSFSKSGLAFILSSVLMSKCGLKDADSLNSITVWNFLKVSSWSNAYLKALKFMA